MGAKKATKRPRAKATRAGKKAVSKAVARASTKTATRKKTTPKRTRSKAPGASAFTFGGMLPPALLQALQAKIDADKPVSSKPVKASKPTPRVNTVAVKALLTRATLLAPSKSALQLALDVTAATLREWAKNGVPKDQLPTLRRVVSDYAAAEKQAADNLKQQAVLLKKALGFASNPVGLARALIVEVADVFVWSKVAGKKSLAPVVLQALHKYVSDQEAEAARKAAQRKIFRELMRLARKSKDEKGRPLVPRFKNTNKSRVGPRTIGWTWTRVFEDELTPQLLDAIDVWITSLPDKGFRYWQAIAHVTQFGGNKFIGYQRGNKPGPKQIGHKHEGEFASDTELGGRAFHSKEAARGNLIGEFEEGNEEGIFMLVHAVAVNTFTHRTDEERRQWETERRRERARAAKEKKTKAAKPARKKSKANRVKTKKSTAKKLTRKNTTKKR